MHQLPHEPQLEHKLRTLEKSIFLEKTKYLTKQPKKQLATSPPPLSKKKQDKERNFMSNSSFLSNFKF